MDDYMQYKMNEPDGGGGNCGCLDSLFTIGKIVLVIFILLCLFRCS